MVWSIWTASSALPYRRTPPSWLKTSPEDVVEQIIKFARKGLTPSQIGVTLRDSHGIPQVRFVTGNKILRILKSNGALLQFNISIYSYTHFFFALPPISFFDSQFLLCTYLLFGDRTWPIHPWGPLAPHQKGGCRSQASWSQSQGQGLEVPSYFDRVKNSQACEILQDKPEACSHFQVWCGYCFDTHCLILWYILSLLEPLKVVMSVMVYFTYVSC